MSISHRVTMLWNLFFNNYALLYSVISGFLILPVTLFYISSDKYGYWLAATGLLSWITLIDPGISTILTQQVSNEYGKDDHNKLKKIITSGLILSLIISIVMISLGVCFYDKIFNYINFPINLEKNTFLFAFKIYVVASALLCFSYTLTSINQGLLSSLGVGFIFVIATLTELILLLVLITSGTGVLSFSISLFSKSIILILGNFFYLFKRLKKLNYNYNLDFKTFIYTYKLCFLNLFSKSTLSISQTLPLILLNNYVGSNFVTVYSVTKRAFDFLTGFISRPVHAIMPSLSNLYGCGNIIKTKLYAIRLFIILFWLSGLIFTGLYLLNRSFISIWVGIEYYGGYYLNLFLLFYFILSVFINIISYFTFTFGNVVGNPIILFFQSSTLIFLQYLGIKKFGIHGLILLPTLSFMLSLVYFPYKFKKLLHLTSSDCINILKNLIITLSVSFLTVLFSITFSNTGILHFILQFLIITSVYLILLVTISSSFRHELAILTHFLKYKFINSCENKKHIT